MSSATDELTEMGVDLVKHASTVLQVLMSATAYAAYKKYFGDDLNSPAAQQFRQNLPTLRENSADGRVHAEQIQVIVDQVDDENN